MGVTDDHESELPALHEVIAQSRRRAAALDELYHVLVENGQIVRHRTHTYICRKGCKLATAFRWGELELCAARDYKMSPGMNLETSVPEARAQNTLDGNRHWPGHTYDLEHLAHFGANAGLLVVCRHVRTTIRASDVLEIVAGVPAGRPGKPTIL